jgi:hexosaminidase
MIPLDAWQLRETTFRIPAAEITDAPRIAYRGLHFDVARNFSNKETVLKLIDLLAFYKLNPLHLHLTDDEGWRIEIPALPELTSIGSKRAHTLTDANWLHPSYGSGPYADPARSRGTGYYSTREFIEILRYATERHITVIPEINFPGHARAAIKSMEARYRKLMSQNQPEKAEEFRLIDPADSSIYFSAQAYNDNVVCVVRESVFHFYETVVKALAEMYRQAEHRSAYFIPEEMKSPPVPGRNLPCAQYFWVQHPEIWRTGKSSGILF